MVNKALCGGRGTSGRIPRIIEQFVGLLRSTGFFLFQFSSLVSRLFLFLVVFLVPGSHHSHCRIISWQIRPILIVYRIVRGVYSILIYRWRQNAPRTIFS